jgi:cytochrome c556
MRGKLDLSQNALEGIVTEDFDQILRSAQGLRVMGLNTMWHMYETPEYIQHSSDFQRVVMGLMEAAEKKNLDGAAVKYVELTLNCVNCHKHVRSVGVEGRRPIAANGEEQLPLEHDAETDLFRFLVDNRQTIQRKVTMLPNGVETVTESDIAQVRQNLIRHVESMHRRMKEGQIIHQRDPLFVELFKQADKITTRIERTEKGLKVRETSDDDYAVKVIQAHAEVVSLLLKNGRQELRKNHDVPPRR